MDFDQITADLTERVLTITLNRPDRLNAWTAQMGSELIEAFDRADADDEVRAVIVTSIVLRQLVCSASGELGDLLLHAPQPLHLVLEAPRDLSILTGHLDTMLADGVASDRDRGRDPLKREVGDCLVTAGAEDETDGAAILPIRDELVDGVDVEVHLARELRLERTDLQVDDHEAAGRMVKEEEIEDELLAADLE
jgi:hypothetical protein